MGKGYKNKPARVKKRNTKGTQATKLCVTLLLITQVVNQLLNRDWFRVARCISLCEEPVGVLYQLKIYRSSRIPNLAALIKRFASEFIPATATATWSSNLHIFSEAVPVSKSWPKDLRIDNPKGSKRQ